MSYIIGMNTNRSFRQIDEKFGLRLGEEIRERVKIKPNLTILDIACGSQANAISDLLAYHPKIKGIGLDYQLDEGCEMERLMLVKGDLFAIPFENVADVTYNAFVLADVTSWDCEEHTKKLLGQYFKLQKHFFPMELLLWMKEVLLGGNVI